MHAGTLRDLHAMHAEADEAEKHLLRVLERVDDLHNVLHAAALHA
jgi:hypothetical protein